MSKNKQVMYIESVPQQGNDYEKCMFKNTQECWPSFKVILLDDRSAHIQMTMYGCEIAYMPWQAHAPLLAVTPGKPLHFNNIQLGN